MVNELFNFLLEEHTGEEKLKELVDELNRHIVEYNEKLFNRAFEICKN